MNGKIKSFKISWDNIWESYYMTGFILPALINSVRINIMEYQKENDQNILDVLAELKIYYLNCGIPKDASNNLFVILSDKKYGELKKVLKHKDGDSLDSVLGMCILSSKYMGSSILVGSKDYASLRLYYKRRSSSFSISVRPVYGSYWLKAEFLSV